MALDALNSSAAVAPRKISKRFNRDDRSEENYLAACLVMLARSGGDCSPSSGAASGEDDSVNTGSITPAAASVKADVEVLTAPPTAAAAVNSYKCSVCDKTFSSYQALGGHKTRHRPKPPAGTAAASSDENNQGSTPANYVSALNPSGRLHECSICHMTFTSGQALGGHKRKHYEGVIGGSPAKSRTICSNGAAAASDQMTVSFPRNFDLNLPPPPELQCDEVESALEN